MKELEGDCGVIFTYVNEDNYDPPDNFGPGELKVTSLRKNFETEGERVLETSGEMFFNPTEVAEPSRYKLGEGFVKMFVLADLEPTSLLVTICYRASDGVLIVYPDFNSLEKEYQLEIDRKCKQIFGYTVENLSTNVREIANQLVRQEKLNKIQDETCELMKKLRVSKDYNFAHPKFCRVVLLLEIIEVREFGFDNIHVRYAIKLPKYAKIIDGQLTGSSHSSNKQGNIWKIGHCHSLVVDIDDEFLVSTFKLDPLSITFEVISIDPIWERERREGIGSFKLYLNSRSDGDVVEILCFRDLQNGSWFADFIERFFLGGIHKTVGQSRLEIDSNFYGNQTVATGVLAVKMQKIIQTKLWKKNYLQMQSVDEIITSYHKAKMQFKK